jgi:hypothetical protein
MTVFVAELFPFSHEHFERRYGTGQNRHALSGHDLLHVVRDLQIILSEHNLYQIDIMTNTQNHFKISHYYPFLRSNPVFGKIAVVRESEEVVHSLLDLVSQQ